LEHQLGRIAAPTRPLFKCEQIVVVAPGVLILVILFVHDFEIKSNDDMRYS
jgi:hypothetical protein